MLLKYDENIKIRVSDYDTYDHLTPRTILEIFQEVAGKHADIAHVGYEDLMSRNLIWVLMRTKYEVYKYPPLYSTLKAITWPHEKGRVDQDRDYLLVDENNDVIVKGTSKWVICDYVTRRIMRMRDINFEGEFCQDINFNEPFDKLENFDIEGLTPYVMKTAFMDLDHNGHVNNTRYADFIMNAIKLKREEQIKSFEIDYVHELPYDSEIKIFYKRDGDYYLVKGMHEDILCFLSRILIINK